MASLAADARTVLPRETFDAGCGTLPFSACYLRMSLLRSICCLFGGRCAGEEPKPTTETMRREAPSDLGQKEAERERASEDQLRRMESGATSTPRQGPH